MELSRGLTETEASALRAKWGLNQIEEKRPSELKKLGKALMRPSSLMLIAASALSFAISHTFDGWFIVALLALNVGLAWWHERRADQALEMLRSKLATSAKVLRGGSWRTISARELVPGDVIECGVGALIPADMKIQEAVNLEINEAVLTGESMPKEKRSGDSAHSGSVVVTGKARGVVVATGNHTSFAKTATSGSGKRRSSMEKDILSISRYLIAASLIAAFVLTIVFIATGQSLTEILLLDLSLFIAGIPVSLPTVMTLIVSFGAVEVAKKNALVRRLAALEDFANTTLLLIDKTGTLTENSISIERVHTYDGLAEEEMLRLSGAASLGSDAALDRAVAEDVQERIGDIGADVEESIPGDSIRKHQTSIFELGGKRYLSALGTPPVIESLCRLSEEEKRQFDADVTAAVRDGSRALALAIKENPASIEDESELTLVGLLVLSDSLRQDAREALEFLADEGVSSIMLTGDTKETAARVCALLGLEGKVVRSRDVDLKRMSPTDLRGIAAFAEVLPEDKLAITELAQKRFTVAVTGDGVNDLPAVRRADVGVAVASAVDALKGVADIVFLAPGIDAIETALTEARKIFFRLYNYSIYRISESFRLVVTVFFLGLLIGGFPLTPIQLILLAFLNDIPIITLAFDRVKRRERPAELAPKERFVSGTLFGLVGVANSMLFYALMTLVLHAPLAVIQTAFFLKLTVSGHMLIYVAHTKERWWRFLPAPSVIAATTATQLLATALALTGTFVAPISLSLILFVWLWAFFWMQVSEIVKRPVMPRSSPREKPALT